MLFFTFHFVNRRLWCNASNVGYHATETLSVKQTNEQMRRPDSEMQRSGGHTTNGSPHADAELEGPRDPNAI